MNLLLQSPPKGGIIEKETVQEDNTTNQEETSNTHKETITVSGPAETVSSDAMKSVSKSGDIWREPYLDT